MVSEIFPSSPTYFQIQLQNDSFHSYVAGQTIIGRVVVELKDKLKIMALKIELVGKGAVHWNKEHHFIENQHRRRRYRPAIPEEETYIYQNKYLIGERAESPVTLPSGVHSFPFFFALSPWLPSSFEGRHCSIRYTLQAKLERALFKDLKSELLKFNINGILDLNQHPGICQPVNVSEHKNRDFLCWKLWSVALILNVEKTGYVPGENLKFSVKFNNSCSNVKLTRVKAYLIQKVTVKAPQAQSTYEHQLLKIRGPVIDAGEIETWEDRLEVPHVEPSGLGLYPAQVLRFNVQYFLKVSAKNVFTTLTRKVALTIGTIPIRDSTTVTVVGCGNSSQVIMLGGGGQQYTPYQNLSEVFPPISSVTSSSTNNGTGDNPIALQSPPSAVQDNNTGSTIRSNVDVNNELNQSTVPEQQLDEQSRHGITISLSTLDSVKTPLKRTDTPPPSYEEAIKKPSNRK